MTPAELFHRAGVALFGEQYVAPLAAALKVEKNTVGKWAAGKSRIPPPVWVELRRMLSERHDKIAGAIALVSAFDEPEHRVHGKEKDPPAG